MTVLLSLGHITFWVGPEIGKHFVFWNVWFIGRFQSSWCTMETFTTVVCGLWGKALAHVSLCNYAGYSYHSKISAPSLQSSLFLSHVFRIHMAVQRTQIKNSWHCFVQQSLLLFSICSYTYFSDFRSRKSAQKWIQKNCINPTKLLLQLILQVSSFLQYNIDKVGEESKYLA